MRSDECLGVIEYNGHVYYIWVLLLSICVIQCVKCKGGKKTGYCLY